MLIPFISRLFSVRQTVFHTRGREAGVAAQLMERAEARGGLSPREAADLRRAAMAYLGVVR